MASTTLEWCITELNKLLKTPSEEIAKCLVNITNEHDLETIVHEVLIGVSESERKEFLNGVKSKLTCAREYRKSNLALDNQDSAQKRSVVHKKKAKHFSQDEDTNNSSGALAKQVEGEKAQTSQKKKTHFVSIYSPEGKARNVVTLPGRNPCTCLASKHPLINNCLNCGRIVCAQEGSGSCFTCCKWVGTPEETTKRNQLPNQEKSAFEDKNVIKAREQRDRLLACSGNNSGPEVIDDQTDFYLSEDTKWMSAKEKEEIRKQEEKRKQEKKAREKQKYTYTIDLVNREVLPCDNNPAPPTFQNIDLDGYYEDKNKHKNTNIAPYIDFEPPKYVGENGREDHVISVKDDTDNIRHLTRHHLRIQDAELQLMSDEGMCLSMHQPWASLLIRGIKVHEGRSWYTAHRGCLWIHAAKKEPTQNEIREIVGSMQLGKTVQLPKLYPTSCLLGCVTVVDCLPQEEYRQQYPYGESGSPYVFICENPQELFLKLPMSGKHKIFRMDPDIHAAAKKTLRKSASK